MKRNFMLTEIIFSVVILIVVGIVVVGMFLQSDTMQNKARDLDLASLAAQSSIEEFKAESLIDSESVYSRIVYFDRAFNAVTYLDDDGFILTMEAINDGTGLYSITSEVEKVKPYFWARSDETVIISLNTSIYSGGGK